MSRTHGLMVAAVLASAAACSNSGTAANPEPPGATADAAAPSADAAAPSTDAAPPSTGALPSADAATPPKADAVAGDVGATNPLPPSVDAGPPSNVPIDLPKPAGACPAFRAGVLTFNPAGGPRTATVTMSDAATTKAGPLIFYWHSTNHLPIEAESGLPLAQIAAAGGIVVAPSDVAGAGTFPWLNNFERHVALFDEVVGCAVGNPRIDLGRIHAVGFSAGAIMTTHLSFVRADTLASIAAYSGGTNERFAVPGHHKFAAMIMTGGKGDIVVQNFFNSSQQWKMTLDQAGHFTLLCDHGGGHSIPRALVPGVWQFLVDHPYGTAVSPYAGKLPAAIGPPCVL